MGRSNNSGHTESGLTEIRERRMEEMAIRRGWIKGQRWPTDATQQEIKEIEKERDLTLREKATKAVMTGLDSRDARIRQIAVKTVVAMEKQNQIDELPEKDAAPSVNVNVGVQTEGPVQIYLPDNGRTKTIE